MDTSTRRRADRGFTLIEMLIVIVVLGVLATIVVFAVRGIRTLADDNSTAADAKTMETAEEGHMALHGVYAEEDDLIAAGLLREESQIHDVQVLNGGEGYLLIGQGSGGPPAWPVPAGQTVASFGGGAKKLVILGVGTGTQGWWDTFTTGSPLTDTQVIWVNGTQSVESVEAIFATNPTYVIVPVAVPITNAPGHTYVGQYLNSVRPIPHAGWWWGIQQGPMDDALNHYRNAFGG